MSEKEIIELVASIEAVKDFTKDGEFYAYIFRSDNGATYVDRVPFEDGRFYSKELSQVGSFEKEVN